MPHVMQWHFRYTGAPESGSIHVSRRHSRPGFVAYAAPLVRLHRQTVLRIQKTPADFYREIWEEYDRDNATFSYTPSQLHDGVIRHPSWSCR